MLYIMVTTAEKATKLGHDHFCIKDSNDFSQFSRTEVNKTQGYAIRQYKLVFTILLITLMQINYCGEVPFCYMLSSVAGKSHVKT